jgi:hypothetical protein
VSRDARVLRTWRSPAWSGPQALEPTIALVTLPHTGPVDTPLSVIDEHSSDEARSIELTNRVARGDSCRCCCRTRRPAREQQPEAGRSWTNSEACSNSEARSFPSKPRAQIRRGRVGGHSRPLALDEPVVLRHGRTMAQMPLRLFRRWREHRSKRRAEHYAQLSDDQRHAISRFNDRPPLSVPGPVPPPREIKRR